MSWTIPEETMTGNLGHGAPLYIPPRLSEHLSLLGRPTSEQWIGVGWVFCSAGPWLQLMQWRLLINVILGMLGVHHANDAGAKRKSG